MRNVQRSRLRQRREGKESSNPLAETVEQRELRELREQFKREKSAREQAESRAEQEKSARVQAESHAEQEKSARVQAESRAEKEKSEKNALRRSLELAQSHTAKKSLWDWAVQPPLDLRYGTGATGIRTPHDDSNLWHTTNTWGWPSPVEVVRWEEFVPELPNSEKCPETAPLSFPGVNEYSITYQPERVCSEPGVSTSCAGILKCVAHWARMNTWILNGAHTLHQEPTSESTGIKADYALVNDQEEETLCVFEVKPWWAWNFHHKQLREVPSPKLLPELWESEKLAQESPIRQIFTYMLAFGVQHAAITTFKHWYFLKLQLVEGTGDFRLLCSDPVHVIDGGYDLSIGQVLLYFFSLVVGEERMAVETKEMGMTIASTWKGVQKQERKDKKNNSHKKKNKSKKSKGKRTSGSASNPSSDSVEDGMIELDDTMLDHSVSFPVSHLLSPMPVVVENIGVFRSGTAFRTLIRGVDAVIKISDVTKCPNMRRELLHEAEVYDELSHLQGVILPKLLFVGEMYLSRFGLATSYHGKSIVKVWDSANATERDRIKNECAMCLKRLHEEEIIHGDPRGDNFVMDENGKVWIIDLACSKDFDDYEDDMIEARVQKEWDWFNSQFDLNDFEQHALWR